MQYFETVEPHDDSNKIAVDSTEDSEIQKGDENISDSIVEKKEEIEVSRLVKKVFFQFDSVDIQSDYFTELNDIAGQLDASPETSALIIGYSDNIGDDEYNLALSMKRARAVVSYLARQDISTDRLSMDGRGVHSSEEQSESNAEKMHPDMSRMVEIYFIPPN